MNLSTQSCWCLDNTRISCLNPSDLFIPIILLLKSESLQANLSLPKWVKWISTCKALRTIQDTVSAE